MKKNLLALFTLVGVMSLSGCEESNDPQVSEDQRIQQILDRLEKNEGISYQIFDILGKRMTSDSLKTLRAQAATKESFINVVARQTNDYFNEAVQGSTTTFDITTTPTPFSGEAEITLKALASAENAGAAPFDVVGEYSKAILKAIGVVTLETNKELIFIQSPDPKQTESVSLNFTKVEMLATVPHKIILDLDLNDDEVAEAIKDVFELQAIPPVVVALLLPAVQAFHTTNSHSDQPFDKAMNTWLNGPIAQAKGSDGLDRDIIRRIQATVYLATLHTILLDEYKGTNPDVASLSVLHARYRAALIMATRDIWVD